MLKQLKYGKEFEALFKEHYTPLYHYAYRFLNDMETSKDVVSSAFEYLWQNYEEIRKGSPVSALYRTVRTKSIDCWRHAQVEANYAEAYSQMAPETEEEDEEDKEERLERVRKAVEQLPPQTRHILEECYFNQRKYAEVAEMLNISTNAVKKHIMKALRLLREEFNIKKRENEVPEQGE